MWILTFCKCLVENARFGGVDSHFLRRSRDKRSFWKVSFSVFAKSVVENFFFGRERERKGNGKSKEFAFSLRFALGAFAVPLDCWKVNAREFAFQVVAVTVGFAFSCVFLRASRCHWAVAPSDFFVARCARGGSKLLETEIREFTFQLVAVASGKAKRKGKGSARGACSTTWLLEGEHADLPSHTWILIGYLHLLPALV